MNPIPDEFWIVVTQYDTTPGQFNEYGPPKGPLVHEGYCHTYEEAIERGKLVAGRYGWATILRVDTTNKGSP